MQSHSADVSLRLAHHGGSVPLAQVAPEWVILAEAALIIRPQATVVTQVDGSEQYYAVVVEPGAYQAGDRIATS